MLIRDVFNQDRKSEFWDPRCFMWVDKTPVFLQ